MSTSSPVKTKKRLALIKGGERYSLRVEEAYNNLRASLIDAGHEVLDIHHTSSEIYLHKGKEHEPHAVLPYADAAINLTSSKYNYNSLSSEVFGDMLASADTLRALEQMSISVPKFTVIRKGEDALKRLHSIWRTMHTPLIIKCNQATYPSLLTFNFEEALSYIRFLHDKGRDALLTEYLDGDKFFITIIPNFRGEKFYSPIPLHIVRPKYSLSNSEEHIRLTSSSHLSLIEAIKLVSRDIHNKLGISTPATYEFVNSKNSLKLINLKTKLDFHPNSKFSKSISTTGVHLGHLISNYID